MSGKYDIVIIGGGASGLAAALEIRKCNENCSVLILEKKESCARKLAATGNGRCNLSNISCDNLKEVLEFLEDEGIAIRKDDSGRIYPYSEDAGEVAEALIFNAKNKDVKIATGTEVKRVEAGRDGCFHIFVVEKNKDKTEKSAEITAGKLLIAAGGKSYASFGTTGDGFAFARSLGHKVIRPVPSLTAIEVTQNIKQLKGIRAKGQVSLFRNNELVFTEKGEIQFREDSLSGICVMNASAYVTSPEGADIKEDLKRYKLSINLMPELSAGELLNLLKGRASRSPGMSVDILRTILKKPLAEYIFKLCNIDTTLPACMLGTEEILSLANALRGMRMDVSGLKGWNEAQVTAGGVDLEEIDTCTMESKLINGLYFAGEVTNYAGPCGGFNLNYAWFTGIKAGKDMAHV